MTMTPPTAPPMMGPRGTDVLLGATADVLGGGVIIDTIGEVSLVDVSFECEPVGGVVDELDCWAETDEVVVAGIGGGFA